MLSKTKPSSEKCNDEMYMCYLLSEPRYTSCVGLSTVMKTVSHDSINRFLERERFEPKDLFDKEKDKIELIGGVLSVDDTVLDKPYSDVSKVALMDYFWSVKHHRVVKGINIISLFYTDIHGISVPVNYRIYDKSMNKTKNDYFKEMLIEVMLWGVLPAWVTGDCWYASLENLKFIRHQKLNFMFGVESNRIISSELSNLESVTKIDFDRLHNAHWGVERFHRAIKQVCNIERFQVRNENPIKNHIFCALDLLGN